MELKHRNVYELISEAKKLTREVNCKYVGLESAPIFLLVTAMTAYCLDKVDGSYRWVEGNKTYYPDPRNYPLLLELLSREAHLIITSRGDIYSAETLVDRIRYNRVKWFIVKKKII